MSDSDDHDVITPDDFKIVAQDDFGNKWSLGDIRRRPLQQKFKSVSYKNLPVFNHSLLVIPNEQIGKVNRSLNEAQARGSWPAKIWIFL